MSFLTYFSSPSAGDVSPDVLSAPWDIIIAVDNSVSMGTENAALEQNLYPSLVQPLEDAGMDPQVIVIGDFGTNTAELCFENPLGAIPFGACAFNPPEPANTPNFKHYSVRNLSFDTWCNMFKTFDGAIVDEFFQQPAGWSAWLRPNAFKQIIILTDDRIECTFRMGVLSDSPVTSTTAAEAAGADFDAVLLALSPEQFGTATERRYMLHALVGVNTSGARPGGLRLPSDPLAISSTCAAASRAGGGYQAAARLTQGLRFSSCEVQNQFDVFFGTMIEHPRIFSDSLETP